VKLVTMNFLVNEHRLRIESLMEESTEEEEATQVRETEEEHGENSAYETEQTLAEFMRERGK